MTKFNYDHYRVANWAEVLDDPAVLEPSIRADIDAQNDATKNWLDQNIDATYTDSIAARMVALSGEDDETVPVAKPDGYSYFSRSIKGQDYAQHLRFKNDKADAEVFFDPNVRTDALGTKFYNYSTRVSPDGKILAVAEDTTGAERFTLRFWDIENQMWLPDTLEGLSEDFVWGHSTNPRTIYFIEQDKYHRPVGLNRFSLGSQQLETMHRIEKPELQAATLETTNSGRFIVYSYGDFETTEQHLIRADTPKAELIAGPKAQQGFIYDVTDLGNDELAIHTNYNGAREMQVMTANVATWADPTSWRPLVPEKPNEYLHGVDVVSDNLVLNYRYKTENYVEIRSLKTNKITRIRAADLPGYTPDEAYNLSATAMPRFDDKHLHIEVASPRQPARIFQVELTHHEPEVTQLRDKRDALPADFDPADYVVERHWATGHDGAQIPITVLKRADAPAQQPVFLDGYGAYGHAYAASFNPRALTLADQGFAYAIAHVRGGSDVNRGWYLDGKFAQKTNTFNDYISVAEHLCEIGLTEPGKIVAQGRSAGGMLMGAITNARPDLFGAVIAGVPFTDVLHTMQNGELPLTPGEYNEWGNPADPAVAKRIASYSPIDNISAKDYPAMYITGGISDFRVTFWEPLIYARKLQDYTTSDNPVLLNMNTGAGHFGASGRYGRYSELATELAFAAHVVGLTQDLAPAKD